MWHFIITWLWLWMEPKCIFYRYLVTNQNLVLWNNPRLFHALSVTCYSLPAVSLVLSSNLKCSIAGSEILSELVQNQSKLFQKFKVWNLEGLLVVLQVYFNTPFCISDDIDLELRMARFEHLMDRRPLLLSRYFPKEKKSF